MVSTKLTIKRYHRNHYRTNIMSYTLIKKGYRTNYLRKIKMRTLKLIVQFSCDKVFNHEGA